MVVTPNIKKITNNVEQQLYPPTPTRSADPSNMGGMGASVMTVMGGWSVPVMTITGSMGLTRWSSREAWVMPSNLLLHPAAMLLLKSWLLTLCLAPAHLPRFWRCSAFPQLILCALAMILLNCKRIQSITLQCFNVNLNYLSFSRN